MFLLVSSNSHHWKLMAASSSSASPQEQYDVFLSFRGEDTRHNFTSHLYAALCQKQIKTFIDDEELKTGDQISPSLLNAIEQSKISLIIFSKGYASSGWCLEELVKILECKKCYGRIVIPVFYGVDPSHIRNQNGAFGDALTELEKRFKGSQKTLQGWRTALKEAANLSGFDSNVIRSESTLVKKVVEDILERLNKDSPLIENKKLVGVDSRIEYIERQLLIGFPGVCKIGIWGIGGIGKTTLADAVFNKISRHFESSYFVKNIREESEKSKGLIDLHQKLICAILEDKHANIGSTFTKRRLACKKVLIVFDDVTDLKQIEYLIGHFEYMGSGSRFIITTRDKRVLEKCEVDYIYETEILSDDVALELFSLHAFRQNLPPKDFMGLSKRVLSYAKGVPLALEVLGSSLDKRTKKEWESSIKRLSRIPDMNIQKVLKVSYDGLNIEERAVFLDIACFFKGYTRDFIEATLDGCGFASHIDINVLIERSLIIASFDTITMHDLLQEMGRDIVRQESPNDPGKRSRLWDHEDILKVLTKNKGTEVIRSMRLDMSKVSELHLKPEAFNNMQNLKFLEVYGCEHDEKVPGLEVLESYSCLPCLNIFKQCFEWFLWNFFEKNSSEHEKKLHGFENLKSDFSELRYFCWDGYSANSLPPNFNPKNLVALYMRYSKVKQLWKGDQLDNLKYIDLSYSKHLLIMSDLSLIPNLERLIMSDCSNLEKVSFGPCAVKVLLLDGTAIKELTSLEHLVGLIKLSLKNCSRLESLPDNICELKCLRYLYLSDCSKLDRLPNGLGNLKALEELEAEGLAIRDIPLSIKCLKNLKRLSFARCRIHEPPSSLIIHLSVFNNLKDLNLSDCRIEKLPNNLGKLSSLISLYLGGNNFETLPVSIKDLHYLIQLDVSNCPKLKSLPLLDGLLEIIEAHSCTSLEAISGLSTPGHFKLASSHINFTDCFNLKFHALPYLTNALANFQRTIIGQAQEQAQAEDQTWFGMPVTRIYYSGSEIPEWFSFKSIGNFIKLPAGWLNDNLIGFVLCAAVSFRDHQELETFIVKYALVVNGKYISCGTVFANNGFKVTKLDHVGIVCNFSTMCSELLILSLNSEAYIQFFVENWRRRDMRRDIQFGQVKKCGVKLLYSEDNELRRDGIVEREQRLNSINCSVDDCLHCCLGYCETHGKQDFRRFNEILDRWSPHPRVYMQEGRIHYYISEEDIRRFPCQSDG